MKSSALVLFGFLLSAYAADPMLIWDFFSKKNIGAVQVITCRTEDAVEAAGILQRRLQFMSKVESYEDIHDFGGPPVHYVTGISLELTCSESRQLLLDAQELKMFSVKYSWLCHVNSLDDLGPLTGIYLSVASDVTIATSDGDLYEIYQVEESAEKNVTLYGKWKKGERMDFSLKRERDNFHNITIKGVSHVINMPFQTEEEVPMKFLDETYHRGLDAFIRRGYILQIYLSQMYNYTLEFALEKKWGDNYPNCTFDGVIGSVQKGIGDIGMIPLQSRHVRFCAVEFHQPIDLLRLYAVFLQPKSSGTYRALALPFSGGLWLCIGGFTALFVISAYYLERLFYDRGRDRPEVFSNAFLDAVGAISQQGVTEPRDRPSARVFIIVLLVYGVLVAVYYNSAIMNALLSPSPNTIRDLRTLLSSDIKIGFLDTPYMTHKPNLPILFTRKLVSKMQSNPKGIVGMQEGLHLVKTSRYALCAEMAELYDAVEVDFVDSEKCDVRYVAVRSPVLLAPFVTKFLPYKEHFERGLMKFREWGLMSRLDGVWYPPKPTCLGSQRLLYVTMEAVSVALWIFTGGIAASLALLSLEILSARSKRR